MTTIGYLPNRYTRIALSPKMALCSLEEIGSSAIEQCVEDLLIGRRQLADRPIGPIQQSLRSERLQSLLHVGPEIGRRPVRPIGFRHHAGELADDVGVTRGGAKIVDPVIEPLYFDARFGEVIENQRQAREALGQRPRMLQVSHLEEQVERNIVRLKDRQAAEHVRSQNEIVVGLVVREVVAPRRTCDGS